MAELCRKCFIELWHPSQYDIDHIVMSKDETMCEGCMTWGPYVDHIKSDGLSDDESYEIREQRQKEMQEWMSIAGGQCIKNILKGVGDWDAADKEPE